MRKRKFIAPGTEIVVDHIRFGYVDHTMNDHQVRVRLAVHNWPFADVEVRNINEVFPLELTPISEQYEEALL